MNSDYISPQVIYNRLSSVYRNKIANFSFYDIAQWCYEVEVEYLKDPVQRVLKIGDPNAENDFDAIKISKHKAELPVDLYKLIDVYDQNMESIYYYKKGSYLHFDTSLDKEKCYIKYYALQLDPETGFPMIKTNHEQACYSFCRMKMHEEDFYSGKINGNVWQNMELDFSHHLSAVDSSLEDLTHQEAAELQKIMMNIVINPTNYPIP